MYLNPTYTESDDNYDRGLKKPEQFIKKFAGKKVLKNNNPKKKIIVPRIHTAKYLNFN